RGATTELNSAGRPACRCGAKPEVARRRSAGPDTPGRVGPGWGWSGRRRGRLLGQGPDADRNVVSHPRAVALRLADLPQAAVDGREPLVDVVFQRRLDQGAAVAAEVGEHLDSFAHGCPSGTGGRTQPDEVFGGSGSVERLSLLYAHPA